MTDEGTPLDSILNDAQPADDTPPTPEVVEAPPVEQPRDEHGRFAPKGDNTPPVETSAPPAPETAETGHIPMAALKDERTKRQEAERRASELEQQLAAYRQPQQHSPQPNSPQPQAPEAPDPWEDPHGFANWTAQQAVAAAMQNLTPVIEQRFVANRVQSSVQAAKAKYADFDEKWAAFEAMEAQNPALTQAALQQPDPAEYVYRTVKNYELAQQLGTLDVDALKAKLREEIIAEEAAKLPNRPSLPSTIATERNLGTRSGPAWSGPRSLAEILN